MSYSPVVNFDHLLFKHFATITVIMTTVQKVVVQNEFNFKCLPLLVANVLMISNISGLNFNEHLTFKH